MSDDQNKSGKSSDESPKLPFRQGFVWLLVLVSLWCLVMLWSKGGDLRGRTTSVSYSPTFENWVKNNEADRGHLKELKVVVRSSDILEIEGEHLEKAKWVPFKVTALSAGGGVEDLMKEHGVAYKVVYEDPMIAQIILNVGLIVVVMVVIYFLFVRQLKSAGQGAMNFGKSRAKMMNEEQRKVTFEDVAGIDEAKEEVQEVIEFLKDPKKFQSLGGRIPKGIMLVGPPGTGKTLLAKAIAGEADVPFFSISGSDFVEMFVGVGASRVRDMFEQGRKAAPCLIFVDEIDAVGRQRFSGVGGGHDEREQTLNALLVEMDGFETQEGVIILAATNRPDVLDAALMRPGRFDRQIHIELPTVDGREEILKMHARKIKLAEDVDLRRSARGTPGFSGADLANLLNEGALLAAREDKSAVEMSDLEEARDKVRWGRERRSLVLDDNEKRITAYHEAGHALVMLKTPETEPLHKITIIPRGRALGATMQLPERDSYSQSEVMLKSLLAGLAGGRVAEQLEFGKVTTGASSDIQHATSVARQMVCDWGMSPLGPQSFSDSSEPVFVGRGMNSQPSFSDETARRIDEEVHTLLENATGMARDILTAHRDQLTAIAEYLLEFETMDGYLAKEISDYGHILSDDERHKKNGTDKDEADGPTAAASTSSDTPAEAEPADAESTDLPLPGIGPVEGLANA